MQLLGGGNNARRTSVTGLVSGVKPNAGPNLIATVDANGLRTQPPALVARAINNGHLNRFFVVRGRAAIAISYAVHALRCRSSAVPPAARRYVACSCVSAAGGDCSD